MRYIPQPEVCAEVDTTMSGELRQKHMAAMEQEEATPVLPLDYDEYDSDEEEEEEELFDNSKVDWRVKGNLLRGKDFSVSDNGNCPRCQSNIFVFVILDELFPMGDMPEILYNLLAKGKAVLWSSQDKQSCKKPPTFMCKGFCPADPLGAGFNINWDTVNLTKLLKDLLKLNIAKAQKKLNLVDKATPEGEGDDEEVDEKDIIRAMLAKEKEKEEEATKAVAEPKPKNDVEDNTFTQESTLPASAEKSSVNAVSISTTSTSVTSAASKVEYPVSKDGSCPYCSSTNVRYIILVKDTSKDPKLPPTLDKLLKQGKAFKMAKGVNNPPSFQCCNCTYGFNLDWSSTDLRKIFNLDKPVSAVTTAATMSMATSSAYQFATVPPVPGYQAPGYQSYSTGYTPYGYSSMYYPTTPMPYGYPTPAYGVPVPGVPRPPPIGGSPPPRGSPTGYLPPGAPSTSAFVPSPGSPPQPGYPPSMVFPQPGFPPAGVPPQPGVPPMYGVPPRRPNMPPNPAYGNPYGQQYPGNFQTHYPGNFAVDGHGGFNQRLPVRLMRPANAPRLRVPRGLLRGRFNNRKQRRYTPRHQMHRASYANIVSLTENDNYDGHEWSAYVGESHENEGTEGTEEDVHEQPALDPEAADRFEELLNKIDGGTEGTAGDEEHGEEYAEHDGEDEKPPGEESQAEFEVYSATEEKKEEGRENGEKEKATVDERENEEKEVAKAEENDEKENTLGAESKNTTEAEGNDKSDLEGNVSFSNEKPTENKSSTAVNDETLSDGVEIPFEDTSAVSAYAETGGLESAASAQPADVCNNEDSQSSVVSELASQEEDVEPTTAPRKTARSRKRTSTGRKKAVNARAAAAKRKKAEKEQEEVDGPKEAAAEVAEQEVVTEGSQESTAEGEKEESAKGGTNDQNSDKMEEDQANSEEIVKEEKKPGRRMTRARAQRLKK